MLRRGRRVHALLQCPAASGQRLLPASGHGVPGDGSSGPATRSGLRGDRRFRRERPGGVAPIARRRSMDCKPLVPDGSAVSAAKGQFGGRAGRLYHAPGPGAGGHFFPRVAGLRLANVGNDCNRAREPRADMPRFPARGRSSDAAARSGGGGHLVALRRVFRCRLRLRPGIYRFPKCPGLAECVCALVAVPVRPVPLHRFCRSGADGSLWCPAQGPQRSIGCAAPDRKGENGHPRHRAGMGHAVHGRADANRLLQHRHAERFFANRRLSHRKNLP